MHDFLLGSLFLPISDRAFVLPEWEYSLTNLNLPRDRFQVILSDSTGGSPVGIKAEKIVRSLGFDFVTINRFKQESMDERRINWLKHLSIGERVGETYEKGLVGVEGPLFLCLEDDILIHPDTFLVLIEEMMSIKDCGMLSACTYTKSITNNRTGVNTTEIIAWDIRGEQLIDNGNLPHLIDCRGTAFGCFVTYSNIIQHFPLKDSVLDILHSPDINYCDYLRDKHNLRVCTTSSVRTQHLFEMDGKKYLAGKLDCSLPSNNLPDYIYINQNTITKNTRDDNSPIFVIGTTKNSGASVIKDIVSSLSGVKIWDDSKDVIGDILKFHYSVTEKRITEEILNNNSKFESCDLDPVVNERMPNHNFISPLDQLKSLFDWYYVTECNPFWGIMSEDWDIRFVNRLHYIYPNAFFIFVTNSSGDVIQPFLGITSINERDSLINEVIKKDSLFRSFFNNLPYNMHSVIIDFSEYKNNLNNINDIIRKELS